MEIVCLGYLETLMATHLPGGIYCNLSRLIRKLPFLKADDDFLVEDSVGFRVFTDIYLEHVGYRRPGTPKLRELQDVRWWFLVSLLTEYLLYVSNQYPKR